MGMPRTDVGLTSKESALQVNSAWQSNLAIEYIREN